MQTQEAKERAGFVRRNVEDLGIVGQNQMLRCKQCRRAWALSAKPGGGYYRGSRDCPNGCRKG